MTMLEDRLRDALGATADLVTAAEALEALEALDDPTAAPVAGRPATGGPAPRERRGTRRWAPAPLVTGIAVVLICVVVATFALHDRSSGGHRTPAAAPGSRPSATGLAPFFLANITGAGNNDNAVTVRSSSTGQVFTRIPPPSGAGAWDVLTGTADPTLFYLLAETHPGLYRLKLTSTGTVASLKLVGDLTSSAFDVVSAAATPDGTSIAWPDAQNSAPGAASSYGAARIDLLRVADRHRQTFTSTVSGRVSDLSWDASGRYLAFDLEGSQGHDGVWVLDTRSGRDLLAGARRVNISRSVGEPMGPVLSADGRSVFLLAAQQASNGDKVTRVVEVDVATGAQRRALLSVPFTGQSGNLVWEITLLTRDPSGRALLAVDGSGHAYRVGLTPPGNQRFPFFGGIPNGLAW